MIDPALYKTEPLGPLYIVVERFDARRGEAWDEFISWSGLKHVQEIVSLDSSLCARAVAEILDEDWPHIVNENFMLDYFTDLEYLLERVPAWQTENLLCVFRNPEAPPQLPTGRMRFEFLGYELVDVTGAASPVTNCVDEPSIFSSEELNRYGLFDSIQRTLEVQRDLLRRFRGEQHSQTHLWAIARAL
jgi:hypothetical protein